MEEPIQPESRKRNNIKIRTFFSSIFQSHATNDAPSPPSPIKSSSFFSLPLSKRKAAAQPTGVRPPPKPTAAQNKRAWMSQPYLLQQEDEHGSGSSSGGEGDNPHLHVARQSSPSLVRQNTQELSQLRTSADLERVVASSPPPSQITSAASPSSLPTPTPAIISASSDLLSSASPSEEETRKQWVDLQHERSKVPSSLNETTSSSQAAMMSAMQAFPPSSHHHAPAVVGTQVAPPPPSAEQQCPPSSDDIASSTASVLSEQDPAPKPLPLLQQFSFENSPGPSSPTTPTPSSSTATVGPVRRPSTAPSSGSGGGGGPASPPPAIFSPSKNNARGMRLSLSRRPGALMGMPPPPLITPGLDFGITEEARTPPREEVRTPTSPGGGLSSLPPVATTSRRRPQTAQARLKSVPSLSREGRARPEAVEQEEEEDADESGEESEGSEDEEERPMEPPLSPTSPPTRRPPPQLKTSFTSFSVSSSTPKTSPVTQLRTPRATAVPSNSGMDYFSLDRGGKISRPSTAGTVRAATGETTPRLTSITPITPIITPRPLTATTAIKTPNILVTPMTPVERERPSSSRRATQSLIDLSASLNAENTNVLPESTGMFRTHGQPPEYVPPPPHSLLRRRSSLPSSSIPPPPYPLLAHLLHPDRRPHPIFISTEPDVLPEYSNMIFKRQTLPRKMEFTGPGIQARDRKWRKVTCELEGTVLRVYKSKRESWWERRIGVGDSTDTSTPVPLVNQKSASSSSAEGVPTKKEGERRTDAYGQPQQANLLVVPPTNPTPPQMEERKSKLGRLVHAGRRRISSSGSGHSRSRSDLTSSTSDVSSRNASSGRSSLTLPRASMSSTSSRDSPSNGSPDCDETVEEPGMEDEDDLELIRSYSLQHAESGLGNDYIKRRNVIRLRCEGEQFLLQALNVPDVVEWIEKLHMAADVSLDLDERPMPRGPMFPRRRRRRRTRDPTNNATSSTAAAGTTASNNGASAS